MQSDDLDNDEFTDDEGDEEDYSDDEEPSEWSSDAELGGARLHFFAWACHPFCSAKSL